MDNDLLDKILERSVLQYRKVLFENRSEILRDIHKATAQAQEEKKEKIRVKIAHSLTLSLHDSMVIDTISHGVKDKNCDESSWQEPHPELPFGEED
ncbi:hypothetical protein UFOVP736_4 [uncultured Caudovirales phage]|uniref:Uncharacterized protein n=1 Tax=uncultured Caudovirales phage TaxID=2100421 RepID=A0A6J5NKS8_9CAUD|nr:hypothetical protein UFOVP705_77 [uncultured Caudovirales phage]CAB5223712.1 hypothetical protein UFOVP736_4 [uncultured Caudovirales phage]